MPEVNDLGRLNKLWTMGCHVKASHRPPLKDKPDSPTCDSREFAEWRSLSIAVLGSISDLSPEYATSFKEAVREPYLAQVEAGIGIVNAAKTDAVEMVQRKPRPAPTPTTNPLPLIETICNRFHAVARQLLVRREDRETLKITDEYDVQDLMHALLRLHFEDVRPEEYAPSYASRRPRMDFLLNNESIAIELKMVRGTNLSDLSSELLVDIAYYREHPRCKSLVCFVYDPSGLIPNPRGVEADLSRSGDQPYPVHVFVRPRH